MPINPYLVFNGNTREALTFYAQVFGQELPDIMEFDQDPVLTVSPTQKRCSRLFYMLN